MISIVGAGPGDPELLTIKAWNKIKQADVLLHDNLVSSAIMDIVPEGTKKINVGRKSGDKTSQQERQERINHLMVQYGREGKNVVRIKSGDPFIYGRAMEEIRYLIEHGMNFETIPGITAGMAAANNFLVPLTERTKTNAVLFCTGHTANYDYEHLKTLAEMLREGTALVMYMGFKTLEQVMHKLRQICGDQTIYVSAFSKVSFEDERVVTGTLHTIENNVKDADPELPVCFIIGPYAYPVTSDYEKQ